jgi:Zn-dependent M28 family amino/carboxypeptidase
MAGAAIIMELARYFTENLPRRTIEFIWFGAEETGLCGSLAYVKEHEKELFRHRFNMNVDLAGQLIGGTVIGVTADSAVCQMLSYMVHEEGMGVSFINGIWGSDSNTFAWKGIPSMTLNRDGFGMHTRYDTIDLISPWSLKRSACVLGCIAERLAQAEVMPFKREVPEEFKRKLDTYYIEV